MCVWISGINFAYVDDALCYSTVFCILIVYHTTRILIRSILQCAFSVKSTQIRMKHKQLTVIYVLRWLSSEEIPYNLYTNLYLLIKCIIFLLCAFLWNHKNGNIMLRSAIRINEKSLDARKTSWAFGQVRRMRGQEKERAIEREWDYIFQ